VRLSRPNGDPVNLAKVDLAEPQLYANGDPHPIWKHMRAHAPVHWQASGRTGFWSVTRLADVGRVLRDHAAFTSQRGTLLNLLGTDDPAGGQQMAATDPPRHAALRSPLQRALDLRAVEQLVDQIRTQVRMLLRPALDGGVFDFAAVTGALPMAVTGLMMGLDSADWARLTKLTSAAIAPDDLAYQQPGGAAATLQRAHRELFAYFQDRVTERQRRPTDDLIGLLVDMRLEGGRRLRPGEIMSNCYSLLLGANVTTPHVANAALPELAVAGYDEWAADPDLLDVGLDEALRWSSPANHFMRYARRDVELHGVTIGAGQAVVAWLGSANRDESAFADPYRYDVRRRPNHHVAFGLGPHYCVGHAVARVSLRVFFRELLDTFAGFEPAGPAEHLCSNFVAGIKHLPVRASVRTAAGTTAGKSS
jgi:cytochrome P450